jgi:polyhydroxyalkanoate synthesis regulator phasin
VATRLLSRSKHLERSGRCAKTVEQPCRQLAEEGKMNRQQAMERDQKLVKKGKITKEEFRSRWFPTKRQLQQREKLGKAIKKAAQLFNSKSGRAILKALRAENQ